MKKLACPSCGSENFALQQIEETRQLTLGPEFSYQVPIHVCQDCDEEISLGDEGDKEREQALAQATRTLSASLIKKIQDEGLKLSYVERAFELPQRTISSKWRTGISASGLALLRIVSTMPWIVNIADNKFTKRAIGQEIINVLSEHGATFETTTGIQDGIHIKFTKTHGQATAPINIDSGSMLISTGT